MAIRAYVTRCQGAGACCDQRVHTNPDTLVTPRGLGGQYIYLTINAGSITANSVMTRQTTKGEPS
jgi:hypothetical protein